MMFRPRPSPHISLIPLFFLFLTLTVYAQADTPKIEQEVIGTLPNAMVDGTLVFSGYSAHYAFVTGSIGKQTVVLDGTPQDRPFKQIGNIRFAPSTHKLFYWALDISGGKETIVLVADGTVIKTDFSGEGSLIFSDDGTQWVIIRGESNGVTVMLNGKKLGIYADATWPRFSPDGKHVAFLAKDKTGKISVLVDGKAERSFEPP
ncbi:MAG: PD40 domain-containing protein, partial [Anaerolineae bacterium]|nr:PD40 domain-containing protein [Anaerolineae bacterium]